MRATCIWKRVPLVKRKDGTIRRILIKIVSLGERSSGLLTSNFRERLAASGGRDTSKSMKSPERGVDRFLRLRSLEAV